MSFEVDRVEFFGASILEQAMNDGIQTGNTCVQNFLALCEVSGVTVNHTYADSGDDSAAYAAKLSAFLTSISGESNVLVIVHGPGNDVTASGPYPGGASTIETNMTTVLSGIVNAGHKVMYGPMTYRVPPASNPTEPYNLEVITDLGTDYSPDFYTGDSAIFNLHQFTKARSDQLETDGIHPSTSLEHLMRSYFARTVAMQSLGKKSLNASEYIDKVVVIAFNDVTTTFSEGICTAIAGQDSGAAATDGSNALPVLIATDGTRLWGSYVETKNIGGKNNVGRGNTGDTSASLTNDTLLSNSMFINAQTDALGVSFVYIRGLPNGLYGTIDITASRDTTATNRVGIYEVQGLSTTLDAATDPPEIISFPFLVKDGEIRVQFELNSGSIFAYVSGIKLAFTGTLSSSSGVSTSGITKRLLR